MRRGKVFQAILDGKSGAELQTLAAFYDYLEIQPVSCDDPEIAARAQTVNQKIARLGDLLHIPVIASGNTYLLDATDAPGSGSALRKVCTEKAYELSNGNGVARCPQSCGRRCESWI